MKKIQSKIQFYEWLYLSTNLIKNKAALIAQLGESQTLDRKVGGSILTRGAVLCP